MSRQKVFNRDFLRLFIREQWWIVVRQLIFSIHRGIIYFLSCSPVVISFYYTFISGAFRREQRAVVKGISRFYKRLNRDGCNVFLLRRNIHRLEKGLLMPVRRKVFGTGYITETVDLYARMLQHTGDCNGPANDGIVWATDVLDAYFTRIEEPDPVIDKARDSFRKSRIALQDHKRKIPYLRNLETPPVTFESLYNLSVRRRAVRWFRPERVPREILDKGLQAAALAPSACNRQPFSYRLFDDPALIKTVATIPMGTKGFADTIPVLAVIVGDLSAFQSERDRHVIYIDASLSAMAFMYALETLGVSSCPVNWPDIAGREKKMARALGLAPYERIVLVMAIGYPDPDGLVACSQKKSLDDLRSYGLKDFR
ncbi:MAG: nitroreductase family protein [Chitinispirillaceae bacterium]|nr:nitroreductase family protein [Chitinispirillaceae bacterium]